MTDSTRPKPDYKSNGCPICHTIAVRAIFEENEHNNLTCNGLVLYLEAVHEQDDHEGEHL